MGCSGNEFEEEGAIYGQISSYTDPKGGIQRAGTDPVRSAADTKPEHTGEEQGGIEGETSPDHIGSGSPERSAEAETDEERAGGVPYVGLRGTEFLAQGGEGQGNGLEPHVVGQPAEAAEDEEFPLIGAHANISDGFVDHLGLAIISRVMAAGGFIGIDLGTEGVESQLIGPRRLLALDSIGLGALISPEAGQFVALSGYNGGVSLGMLKWHIRVGEIRNVVLLKRVEKDRHDDVFLSLDVGRLEDDDLSMVILRCGILYDVAVPGRRAIRNRAEHT